MIKIKALWKFSSEESRQELAARSKLTPYLRWRWLNFISKKNFCELVEVCWKIFWIFMKLKDLLERILSLSRYVVFNSILIFIYQLASILSNSFLENCKEFRIYQRLKWNGIVKLILDLSEYNSIETSNSMWMIMCLQGM